MVVIIHWDDFHALIRLVYHEPSAKRKASMSSRALSISYAALGKRSARELARSSQGASISAAFSLANIERSAAVTMP